MAWPKRIESLRNFVLWECKDIPPDLVLAIIKHESAGVIGRQGTGHTKCGDIIDLNGNNHRVCNAMGLMQTIPATINWYNDSANDNEQATYEDMVGDDDRAARLQIRIGCKFLALANHFLHKKIPAAAPAASLSNATPDQIALALTGFAVGHGATLKKLTAVEALGEKPTFKAIKKHFPNWGKNADGKWINRPITFAETILNWYQDNKMGSFDSPGKAIEIAKRKVSNLPGGGAFAAVLFLAGAGWLINKHFTKIRGINEDS